MTPVDEPSLAVAEQAARIRPQLSVQIAPAAWASDGAAEALLATAEAAASAGWGMYVSEHARRPDYVPSALMTSAYLLGRLPGIRVTTAGVVAGARDPYSVLHDADALAAFAATNGSTFTLGIVPGHDADDLRGPRFALRYKSFDELIEIASRHSRSWGLLVGVAGNEKGRARALQADGWIAGTIATTDVLPERVAQYRSQAPAGFIGVVRRWVPADSFEGLLNADLPASVRTPRNDLVGGGPETVARQLAPLLAQPVDDIILGPITSVDDVERLSRDLSLILMTE